MDGADLGENPSSLRGWGCKIYHLFACSGSKNKSFEDMGNLKIQTFSKYRAHLVTGGDG